MHEFGLRSVKEPSRKSTVRLAADGAELQQTHSIVAQSVRPAQLGRERVELGNERRLPRGRRDPKDLLEARKVKARIERSSRWS